MQLAFTFYHLTYRELWVIRLNRRVVTALVNRNKPKPIPFVTESKHLD
nr:hypothetical protein [uncultured Mediterranean phage uvMED]